MPFASCTQRGGESAEAMIGRRSESGVSVPSRRSAGSMRRPRARACGDTQERGRERTHSVEDGEPELRKVWKKGKEVHVLEVRDPEHLGRVNTNVRGVRWCLRIDLVQEAVQDFVERGEDHGRRDGGGAGVLEEATQALPRDGGDGGATVQVEEAELVNQGEREGGREGACEPMEGIDR